ncbi:Ig-like domain-containing protein [Daejeonella rubra]|uniref:Ig-like domain-containing protein n=1 Tax=Daejeonella rubra TaxID=990371 RepID=A0A1G9SWD6_9SPHI|nr:lamin tail domain-containing protein [Daejeonella rubra]SDM39722.1 Ig-like domain-containing protein [Daejeonella rubra]
MRKILIIVLLLYSNLAHSQLNDDFSDGNFLLNPVWSTGNSGSDFIILNNRLRSNSSQSSGSFYISTPNSLALNCKWEFWVNLQFNTSGANYADIYLIADKADLKSTLINGYFIRVGNTDDEICLYKRSGLSNSSVKIIDGINGTTNLSNNTIRVRVTRNNDGLFSLERELTGNNSSYFTEGTFTDLSFTNSSFFGIYIQQSTSSFFQKHFFDDFSIEPLISDTSPPELTSVSAIDSNILEVTFNEEMDSIGVKNSTNFSINNFNGQIVNIQTSTDPAKFRVKLATELNTGTYTLTVLNVKDKNGNLIQSKNNASFSYIKPYKTKFRDIIINEIFADPAPQIDLPSVEYIELLNTTNETISMHNWRLSDPSSSGVLGNISISPHSYLILCAKADTAEFKKFGKVLGISPWPSLNNSGDVIQIKDQFNLLIDSISYSDNWHRESSKNQGGWSLERISPTTVCEGIFNWTGSKDPSGGTPGKQSSVFILNFDQMTFKTDSLSRLSDSTILIYLNKPLNIGSIINDRFTLLPNAGQIKGKVIKPELGQITLTFSEKFKAGTTYQLSISGIKDCSGNTINNTSPFSFSIPALPAPPPAPPAPPVRIDTAQVFITEIFADPSPEVGLPLVEFIELFNPGKDTIDLEGWSINDPQSKGILKKHLLPPNQYLILCPAADTIQYKSFGRTLGISPWPSLKNSDDQISLKSFKNRVVDSISYSDTWYADPMKKQGGWSLERIDHLSKCSGQFIWTASKDLSGGTPGKQNSIYVPNYDKLILKADSMNRMSDSTLLIYFNKQLIINTLIKENFTLSPISGQIKEINNSGDFRLVTLKFSEKFKAGAIYQLSITGIKDCSGNTFSSSTPFSFSIPALPAPPPPPPVPLIRIDTARIFITEIFADPSPEVGLPLVEFIELFNPGMDTLDLEGWSINDPQTKGILKKYLLPPNQYLILCPAADTLQYKSFGRTLGISPWPSLKNSDDQIVLKSFKNRMIDSVSYFDIWYADPIKKQGGWSLERIDQLSKCAGQFIWTASKDQSGGTPGKQNSIYVPNYDKLILKADSLNRLSDSTLLIYFNKALNNSTLTKESFSLLPISGQIKEISSSGDFRLVTLKFSEKFKAGTTYQLSINGIKDCSGNTFSSSTPFSFSIPALPAPPPPLPVRIDTAQLFITEIFADPSPEVGLPLVEFMELFNPGKDTINLEEWSIQDPQTKGTLKKYLLPPNQYLIICPAADTTQYKSFGRTLGISPWPSLNNSSDQIILKSFRSRTVDSVSYSDIWYADPIKKQGGWSLERIDHLSKCTGPYIWTASKDQSGGTPGKQNSSYVANYDKLILKADSINRSSDTSVFVYFNKPTDPNLINKEQFSLLPNSGQVKQISTNGESKGVQVIFSEKFKAGTTYQLSITGIKDCSGNAVSNTSPFSFSIPALPPPPPTPPVPPVRIDTAKVFITEIFADPSPEVGLPLVEFIELFNPGKDTIDLEGWSINDPQSKGILKKYLLPPNQFLILCPAADTTQYKSFGRTLGISPWPSLKNSDDQISLKSFKNRVVDSVSYFDSWYADPIKKQGGWSLERIDHLSKCSGQFIWTASIDQSGGTPGEQNSIYVPNYDKLILKADSLNRLSDSTLLVYFNKALNNSTLTKENFSLLPISGQIKEINSSGNFKQVTLKFSQKFKVGTSYQLSITGIKDCSGNTFSSSTPFSFSIPTLPAPPPPPPVPPIRIDTAKVFITEIFADPSPEVGLPLVEFIELFNPGKDTLDLEGWSINDPQSKGILKKYLLPPNQFLILCPAADTTQYKSFGRTLGISPWPSLKNSDDQISLKSFKNRVVDSVSYFDSWYADPIKKQGGWSLERIDHLSKCSGHFIWTASKDQSGGTPGKQNAAFIANYDKLILKADSLTRLSDSTLLIHFNKPLIINILTKDNFTLSPISGQIKEINSSGDFKQLTLKFSEKFKAGTIYQLSITRIKDCSGNTFSSSTPFSFSIPALPPPPPTPPVPPVRIDTVRVFITEIFADPSPEVGLPLVEFIELFNPGTDTLDLEGWSISDPQSKGILKKHLLPPNQYLILCPAADTIQYKSFGRTLGISPWPSLNNSSDQIVLKSFKNRTVDSVNYSEKWYKDPKKQRGGWTLEKIDLTKNKCDGFYNWASSADGAGGTPGRKNSRDYPGFSDLELKIDSVHIFSENSIDVYFNRIPDTSYYKASNFSINNGAENALQISIDSTYKRIRLTFKQKFSEGEKYILSVDSLFTCSGISIKRNDASSAFGIASITELEYPILINEIFADPSPVIGLPEAEFIELFNPTENIVKLKGLSFGKNYTFQFGEIASGSYLILCSEKDTLEFKPYGKVIGIPGWSSLNNQSDTLRLRNNKGRLIQQINYVPGWFRDSEKRKGGYSLELIDPKSICPDFQNWISSSDSTGGTPGKKNSMFQQNASTEPLKLIEIEFLDSISISLSFNRTIDSLKGSIPINFNFNNGVGNPEYALPQAPNFDKVVLKLREPLTRGQTYRITASNIGDCRNISITTEFNFAEFQLTPKIEKNDVILTEILFNPRAGGSDFVEIYNNTSHSIDLKELSLARISVDTVNSIRVISRKQLLLESGKYLALSTNPDNISKEYIVKNKSDLYKMTLFPAFNDDSGSAALVSNGKLIDQLSYNEKMHFPLIKYAEGISLERSKLNKPASESGNLRSATTASGGATPGYQNSQNSNDLITNEDFSIVSKTFSPDNDGFEDLFEMKYKFSTAGEIANISIFNDQGVLIKKLIKNFTLNSEGTFIWDGLNEQSQLASPGIYLLNAEIFNLEGKIKRYRRSFALVSKFN